jgi:predicted metal-dependent peptidase
MSDATPVLRSVASAVQRLLVEEPFYAHVLMRMRREVTEEVETAAVTMREGAVALLVNPAFWMNVLVHERHRVGVLKHEVLHVVLQHLLRCGTVHDRERFNVAADLAVNCHIGLGDLPEEALRIDHPNLLATPDRRWGMSLEWYYERLQSASARDALASVTPMVGGGGEWWVEGSAAGCAAAVRDLVHRAVAGLGARALGRLPMVVQEAIRAAGGGDAPRIDWRRAMRIFGASSRRTCIRNTLKRPSKRFGRIPGVKVRPLSHVAVAIDTSGSIGREQLGLFFAEIHGIWRAGAQVTVIECDDQVRSVWPYRGVAPAECAGGGGTEFDPVLQWVNDRAARFDGLIYLTDGFGERSLSSRRRVLWIVAGDPSGTQCMRDQARPSELVVELLTTDP